MKDYTTLKRKRYERKYVLKNNVYNVEKILKLHPAFFSEIYSKRYVNNLYFDTPDLSYYYDNVFGKSQRKKVRIRWYGELFGEIQNPILEFKIKSGFVGDKLSFRLNSFKFDKEISHKKINNIILKSDIPKKIKLELLYLTPTLVNRYERKYFTDLTKKFRFTIDRNVNYIDVKPINNSFINSFIDNNNIIIELKYDFNNNKLATQIFEHLPFRLNKSSKYVNGIERFHHIPE